MVKTELYIVRHGKTMFNTVKRVQGWCDTPLTKFGEERIHYLGLGMKDIPFVQAVSSDSGRTIQTMRLILGEHPDKQSIPYHTDARIREWCFGSLEGGYDAEMWGIIPRVLDLPDYDSMIANRVSFEDICSAIYKADTANWAETYAELSNRVRSGFEDIAHHIEKNGGGNGLVVSHGLTIAFLMHLINDENNVRVDIDNGSVTRLSYENGQFTINEFATTRFIEDGEKLSKESLK